MDDRKVPEPDRTQTDPAIRVGTVSEVFFAFLKLGLTAFGGPIAHLGYFREEFVTRRRWLSDAAYADLVALCQFLPGPASSQVGFALGLHRAGGLGALAAFVAFTLPSAFALVVFAWAGSRLETGIGASILHGLKLAAVAVVAQAVFGMAKTLAPDRVRAAIAVGATAILAFFPVVSGQIAAIVLGAFAGLALCRHQRETPARFSIAVHARVAFACLAAFVALLAIALAIEGGPAGFFAGIYQAGALVFGGGHVVLPLLDARTVVPGYIDESTFLAGYAAAQAVPGPLFTFGAYLGAAYGGVFAAIFALVAIFLPGFLLLVGALPHWSALSQCRSARAALAGTNAAVVGILAAALYDPVFTSAAGDTGDFALAAAGFVLLAVWRAPPVMVVLVLALGGLAVG